MSYSSTMIPRPNDWQDFERYSKVLFQCILKDPQTQVHGRTGQPQNGVDIWGRRNGPGGHFVGIQCKGRGHGYERPVTEKELREEIRKARSFDPSISEFFIVTTAPDDAKIQNVARQLTLDNERAGHPLAVAVWGWETLESEILRHTEAIQAFHPDMTPFTQRQIEPGEENFAINIQSAKDIREIKDVLLPIAKMLQDTKRGGSYVADTSSAIQEEIEKLSIMILIHTAIYSRLVVRRRRGTF